MFANELAEPNKSLGLRPIARKRANYIFFVVVVFIPDDSESHVARRTPNSEARRKLFFLRSQSPRLYCKMLAEFNGIEILDDCDVPKSREARMQEAFERSKRSYASEQIFTDIGHFRLLDLPAASSTDHNEELGDQSGTSGISDEHDSTVLRLRRLEYRLNDLYLRGFFQEALDLGLAELVRVESNEDGKDGREQQILDISMRCATQLNDVRTAIRLADKTVGKYPNIPGLIATAAEAYLHAGEARKAVPTILRAMSIRGPLPPFLRLLCDILVSLQRDARFKGAEGVVTAEALGELIGHVDSLLPPQNSLLRNINAAGLPPITTITAKLNTVSEGLVRENASMNGFSDVEEQGLVTLLCRSGSTNMAEDVKSVRVL